MAHASRDAEKAGAAQPKPERATVAIVLTLFTVLLHGLLLFTLDFAMLYLVPRFQQFFADMKAELPALTRMLIDSSLIARHYWYLLLPSSGLLLVADGVVFYLLRTRVRSRLPSWLYSVAILLLASLAAGWIVVALHLPFVELVTGIEGGG